MKALLVDGPRDGETIEIPEAVEVIKAAYPLKADRVFVTPEGSTLTRYVPDQSKPAVATYRLRGVRWGRATYQHVK